MDHRVSKVAGVSEEPLDLTLTLKLRTPAPLVASKFATILGLGLFAVVAVGRNHLNTLVG